MWLHSVADIPTEPVCKADMAYRTSAQITLTTPDSSERIALQDFICRRYADAYQANISHFLPLLLTSTSFNEIHGVLGLRPGLSGGFFVEQYLSVPIEAAITAVTKQRVMRSRVIETGNLASLRGGSQRLFIFLTELLYQAGFDWVCFTATPQVAALLQRLGFAPEELALADPARLSDSGRSWGSYYDNKPMVLVGDVQQARRTLVKNELAVRLIHERNAELERAVTVLSAFSGLITQAEGGTRG